MADLASTRRVESYEEYVRLYLPGEVAHLGDERPLDPIPEDVPVETSSWASAFEHAQTSPM
ncbi:hypothetical protein DY240_29855 [Jiangella rhizosphaerae]|uniref:Uncharacterized protein n=1 Tax=Jiangella rhizosphaerae TaxID=2293569 RepID=A0A418KGL6_9ACTN|nr:hypothetical protein DY240_29855 [Jiangella rhizosphaerae]